MTKFRRYVFNRKIIANVWRRIDIYSFNFEIVLDFIRNKIFERKRKDVVRVARFNTFSFMQNYESLNKISRKIATMRKTSRFLNHFQKKHESFNINSLHMRRFVKIIRRIIHVFEFHTRNFNFALKTIVKRKQRTNLKNYKSFESELVEANECKFMYITKKTRNKKIEKRKIKRKIAKKKKKQIQKKQEQIQKKYIEQQNKKIEKMTKILKTSKSLWSKHWI